MIKRGGQETRRLVAVNAITAGRHMVAGFSCGRIAVVTRRTVTDDALVIKSRTGKGRRRMTQRAVFGCRNMVDILAGCIGTVVARPAVIHNSGVIKNCRRKRPAGNVTDAAILARWDVIGLGILAGRINTVVAGIAPAVDYVRARVVDKCVSEIGRVVANGAVPARVLMYWRIGFAPRAERYKCCTAVMARCAISGDIQVTENRRGECRCRVAIGTILACWQMACSLDQIRIGREELNDVTTLTTAQKGRVRC